MTVPMRPIPLIVVLAGSNEMEVVVIVGGSGSDLGWGNCNAIVINYIFKLMESNL